MKSLFFYAAKYLGLFRLCRYWFKDRLLILCYHGFELADEADFMPGVFMRQTTFARRLKALADGGFKVLPLEEALALLAAGELPPNSVCLTLDDGFYSVLKKAAPLLRQYRFPSTLYVTSYHLEKGTPIFRLVVQYMFWKTARERLFVEPGRWGLMGDYDLGNQATKAALIQALIQHGENNCDEAGRQQICQELGLLLGVDYEVILSDRRLSLLTAGELRQLYQNDMDIQLHTRRHRICGVNKQEVVQETLENVRDLQRILPKAYGHFCYPSGSWLPHHPQLLETLGVISATTCDAGMNTASTNRLALYRVLDSESMPDIVFEAQISGFSELLRILSGRRRISDTWRQQAALPSPELADGIVAAPVRASRKQALAEEGGL